MYTSELAGHQNRIVFFRYNLDLRRVFGMVNAPVHNHAKPSNNVYSPLTKEAFEQSQVILASVAGVITKEVV